MYTNEVYLCHIYVKDKNEETNHFVKKALVIREHIGIYRDINTGEVYEHSNTENARKGKPYINISYGLLSISTVFNTNRRNMSKKKVLKKFNEINNQNTNE